MVYIMTIIDDVNSGKYNFIILGVVAILFFHIYWNKKLEPMADVGNLDQIKEAVKQVYLADIEAIRNLSNVATQLQAGGLTIPGNLTIKGELNVSGQTTISGITTVGNLISNGTFNLLPKGTVVAWNGTAAPAGWALCDGANGTPDLRGRFILGLHPSGGKHGKVSGDDYNKLGGIGGNQIHQLTQDDLPSHSHSISGDNDRVVVHGRSFKGEDGKDRTIRLHGGYDGPNIMAMPTGGNQPHNIMPPYYVLAYIMKL